MTLKNTSQRMFKLSIKVAIYVVAAIMIVIVARSAYDFGMALFSDKGMDSAPGQDIGITITKGESHQAIAKDLQESGVVKNSTVFYLQLKLYLGDGEKVYPGEYTLNSSMSGEELVKILKTKPEEESE